MKNCLIIVNTYKEESQILAKEIVKFLDENRVSHNVLEFNGFSDVYPFIGYDFVITLGGDGTRYIDYDIVVATYNELQNTQQVANKLNISVDSVRNILKL